MTKNSNGTIEGVTICLLPGEGLPPGGYLSLVFLYLTPAILMISVFFLILTLLTFFFSPELNLHLRCMTVYCVCLVISCIGSVVIHIETLMVKMVTKTSCYVPGTIHYLLFSTLIVLLAQCDVFRYLVHFQWF
ncbi:hypothetical protein B566_EDAN004652 [Ephemera danica]|nr:hypothetical protein B566_EDAN004652 [Ephemera danica]